MNQEDVLIKRAAAGNKAAYEQLVNKYKGYVYAIILNLVNDSFDAENIAQEVFLQVYISLPQYRFEGFRTWLGRITVRKAIDLKRKQQKIRDGERLVAAQVHLARQDGYGSLEEDLLRREDAERIRNLYSQLPDSYRTVVKKYYFSEKSYRQIASEEGIAVKTVETRLYRARKKLREQWKGDG